MTSFCDPIHYDLTLTGTEASTGYFACVPNPEPDTAQALEYLGDHPMDTFMYRYLLSRLGRQTASQIQTLLDRNQSGAPVVRALFLEVVQTYPHLSTLAGQINISQIPQVAAASPLITLRAMALPDHKAHQTWIKILNANLSAHQALPDPEAAPQPFPYTPETVADPGGVHITQIVSQKQAPADPLDERPTPEATAALALEKLAALDLLEGREMRHESSLSPFGLLQKWRLRLDIDCGRHRYHLSGLQTSYGKGLRLEDARASYSMEIVERVSSFASIGKNRVLGSRQEHPIFYGTRSALCKGPIMPLDPNDYGVDTLYQDEPLHWIEGRQRTRQGYEPVLVPVQSIFLFTNLDEIDLYAAHGSTGLASGNTISEARLSALMEIIERDGEATHPFHHSLCFQVTSNDPKIEAILDDYRARGIQFQFQDISPPYGIPCCKCFVTDMDGRIAKGAAAGLNARRTVISALTETPYPYPYGPPSGPGMLQLPHLLFEELPDYSSGNVEHDLELVEELLLANNMTPVYVDLTRKDLDIPVVRALLPGAALTADLDESSRVHPRLFGNYLKL